MKDKDIKKRKENDRNIIFLPKIISNIESTPTDSITSFTSRSQIYPVPLIDCIYHRVWTSVMYELIILGVSRVFNNI